MHKDVAGVERRIKRFMEQRLPNFLYRSRHPLTLSSWTVPDEPVPFDFATRQTFTPLKVGEMWGRPWGTTWIHVQGEVPKEWILDETTAIELEVDLGFYVTQPGFQAEALVYTSQGQAIKGIHPRNRSVTLNLNPGQKIDLYLEAASNPDVARDWSFRPTEMGEKATAGEGPLYKLTYVDLAVLDLPVYHLLHDFHALFGLMNELSADLPRKHEILRALEKAVDILHPEHISEHAAEARKILQPIFSSPAFASAHTLHAVGHSHIDTAWLWPLRETRRKIARTFSNALNLMEHNPSYIFAASSAQQYKWIKQDQPELFERIKEAVKKGRFIPVGGMWIEPDSNIPSGEALTRQLLLGKKFFMEEFGVEPLDVWLPDSFGYNGSFPQIVKQAGSEYFLTQKISWNDTNVFPHHTFLWEGIDGTQVFTHFPPANTYNSMISASELHLAESKFQERGKTNISLLPFGWGNGGGGPTRDMLESAERYQDLEGSPKVVYSSPEKFFNAAIADYENPPVWVGELYLELHRATSTTQAPIKRGNRLSESLMREVELWAATAQVRKGAKYPHDEINEIWEDILLLQFHDILPGTSISWVHREAAQMYQQIESRANSLIQNSLTALLGTGNNEAQLNPGPKPAFGIEAMGIGALDPKLPATLSVEESLVCLENKNLKVQFQADGTISSIHDKAATREIVPKGKVANLFQLHVDTPSQWDAWDVEASYKHSVYNITDIESLEPFETDSVAGVRIVRKFGSSKIVQEVTLAEDSTDLNISLAIDWYENEKFLKLAFPLALHTDRAASEIQYGHLYRAIHTNTDWDAARFETVAHRWVLLSEPNYGVAIANNSTYGSDITREVVDGVSSSTVRLSLLRAPNFPDPVSDRGSHTFKFVLRSNANIEKAIAAGYALNSPIRVISGVAETSAESLFELSNSSVLVESVKLAEDGTGDVVIRLYESEGIRSTFAAKANFEAKSARVTDSLERPGIDELDFSDNTIKLEFLPFQLKTIRFFRH